jgi:hypothetical protein
MSLDLYGPRLKVERAEHHIHDLETLFERYVSDSLNRLRPDRKHRLLKQGRTVQEAVFPKHTSTVLGDALHNLRVALDHAYYLAAEANGAVMDEFTRFPFFKDRQSLEGSINGHKKKGLTPSDAVIDAIVDRIQPYQAGKLRLYDLHRLDITDKHMVLIPTVSSLTIESGSYAVDSSSRKTFTAGGSGSLTIIGDQSKIPIPLLGVGGGGGFVFNGNPKNAFRICFGKGQPFEGDEILETVRTLKAATVEALDIIEAAAST